MKNFISEIRTL